MHLRSLYARVMCSANASIRHLAFSLAPGYDPFWRQRQTWRKWTVAANLKEERNLSIGKSPCYNCDAISMMQSTRDRLLSNVQNFLLQCWLALAMRTTPDALILLRHERYALLPQLTSTRVIIIMHPLLTTSDETLY